MAAAVLGGTALYTGLMHRAPAGPLLGSCRYWLYVYWRQQKQRAAAGKKEPEKVNCVYEFAL